MAASCPVGVPAFHRNEEWVVQEESPGVWAASAPVAFIRGCCFRSRNGPCCVCHTSVPPGGDQVCVLAEGQPGSQSLGKAVLSVLGEPSRRP